jgi:UrcA family protein
MPMALQAKDSDAPALAVEYSDLDLSSTSGAKALYSRLRGAARQVCADLEGKDLKRRANWKACYDEAVARAVLQVNNDAVSALHYSKQRSPGV